MVAAHTPSNRHGALYYACGVRIATHKKKKTIRISREHNIIQIDPPDGSSAALPLDALMFMWAMFGVPAPIG